MAQNVSLADDLKTAAVLAGAAGLLGALSVPFLLPLSFQFVPPEQRTLPLPLPLFCGLLVTQFLVVYGLIALAGLRLARRRNLEPAPLLSGIWTRKRVENFGPPTVMAFGTGLLCGMALVGAMGLIKGFLPQTLPSVLHPPSVWGSLLGSAAASFGEEILCRLFLLSGLICLLPVCKKGTALAIGVSALAFAALHSPAAVFLFGGLHNVPLLSWVWMLVLNALFGIACAVWYLRAGIGAAILVHFGTDLVWHVVSQLV